MTISSIFLLKQPSLLDISMKSACELFLPAWNRKSVIKDNNSMNKRHKRFTFYPKFFPRISLSLSLSLSLWISTATRTLGNGRTIAFLRSNRLFRRYGNAYTVYVCIDVPKRKILSRVRCIIKPREYGVPISRSRLFSFSFSLSLSVSLSPGQALFRFRPWPCPHPVPMQSNYSLLDAPTGKCR